MEEKLKGKELVSTVITPDGNVELTYNSQSKRGVNLGIALAVPVFLVSCSSGSGLARVAGVEDTTALVFGFFFGFAFVVFFSNLLSKRKEKITIIKGKGIQFLKQELPFSSIDALYTERLTITQEVGRRDVDTKLFTVVARVRGREIEITRGLPQFVAADISDKIIMYFKSKDIE